MAAVAVAVMMVVALDVLVTLDLSMTMPVDGDAAGADINGLDQRLAGDQDQTRSGDEDRQDSFISSAPYG
ncbi:hypothetical protein H0176_00125 [Methylorubrum populi]|uniref:hypothetical protein n=1 Tax=Methylorubrum rhodesianum TaxID=29427 RepID=UPI001AEE3F40|nr:hypothetical protein [Methylorubrum rhodesianum]MBY0138691.1 hypothetical protein [Methylorubrum populi]